MPLIGGFYFDSPTLFFKARAEILIKIALVSFGHQKDISKLTDLYKG